MKKKFAKIYFDNAIDEDNKELSIALLQESIENDPIHLESYGELMNVLWKSRKSDQCLVILDKAIVKFPDESYFYNLRARSFLFLGYFQKALMDYSRAITLSPGNSSLYYNRACLYKKMCFYSKSVDDFSRAIELFSSDASYYNNRGLVYLLYGKPMYREKALHDFDVAIRLNPKNYWFHHNKALVFEYCSNSSISDLQRAVYYRNMCISLCKDEKDKLKELASFYYLRGVLYSRMKQYVPALKNFHYAKKTNPNFPIAEGAYEDLLKFLKDYEQSSEKYIYQRLNETWKVFHKKKFSVPGIFTKSFKGKLAYHGQMVGREREGLGREFFENGETVKFFGVFKGDKRNGFGIELDKNGEKKLRGIWRNGVFVKSIEYKKPDIVDMKFLLPHISIIVPRKYQRREDETGKSMNKKEGEVEMLGQGSFSYVFKVRFPKSHKFYGKQFAFKYLIQQSKSKSTVDMENIVRSVREEREFAVSTNLDHENVMKIIGYSNSPKGIVQELLHRSVFEIIEAGEEISMDQKINIIYQTALGMEYIHLNRIMHRDLNWRNVMIDKPLDNPDFKVKIIDFGLSKIFESYYGTIQNGTICGSFNHIAPEIFSGGFYGPSVDYYSFGIMMFELFNENISPYGKCDPSVALEAMRGKRPTDINDIDPKTPEWVTSLMQSMWRKNYKDRPTFSTVLQIIGLNQKKMKKKSILI